MKNSFLKYTLATIVGSIITFAVIFGIMFGVFSAIVAGFGDDEVVVKNNSVLKMTLSSEIPDKTSDSPFDNIDFMSFSTKKSLGLNDILKTIEKAKKDDRIKGIFLELSGLPAGMASLEEIRNKLIDFKSDGKFIICYSSMYTQKAYYLASIADKIYMTPMGAIEWKGLASQVMFYKGALEKLGIEAQIFRHGQFKSAVEPFMSDKMSEASKLQSITLIQSIWDDICTKVSKEKNIDIAELNMFADSMLIYSPETALKYGFIDGIKYYDEVLAELEKESGVTEKDKDDYIIGISNYSKAGLKKEKKNSSTNKIAVIFAEGDIVDGAKADGSIAGDWMANIIRDAREDDDVKAVVLRVNSPGGSGLASEIIWREVELTNKVKPVVVSMGNLAASGGYYISCPAKYIFAQPNTITGSIGVFGMIPNLEKLMTDKLGITIDGVKTNNFSDYGSIMRAFTPEEGALIQKQIEDFYDVFIGRVADGREMTKAQVDSIGQGRVWSGVNALEIGLVDEIGGLDDAVNKAVSLAAVEDNYRIWEYPEKEDFMQKIMASTSASISENLIKETLGENYKFYQLLEDVKKLKGIQARMPYVIEIY
ncbi:MAG: signal peptide peptidase SppA [Bacteroidales bacterium]|nr:signal peptide peptidase SppA [Bacteroidales bacterium]MDD4215752.1 signal peptide peptidase SppA [Bacteroidales bacterium]MDY0140359.1 signal peptide peptidase SppA [Bacteroidales bacterium]